MKRSPLALILILSTVFFVLFVIVTGGIYLSKSPGGGRKAGLLSSSGQIGVIEVTGVIMDSKRTLKRLEEFEDNDAVKAVVLRLNSPGGAVAPSQEIYEAVKVYKKPLVVSMSSVAASGAYYIACGAKKVFANPGTITGSIGVIMEFVNLSKLYEWAKVQRYAIKTGKFKDSGSDHREMTAEERELLQTMVDDVLLQFRRAVVAGRGLTMEQVIAVSDGRIFSGQQAKAAKLVDELGTMQDAIKAAAAQAKLGDKYKVVYPDSGRRSRVMEFLLDDGSSREDSRAADGWLARAAQVALGPEADAGLGVLPAGVYWLWKGAR